MNPSNNIQIWVKPLTDSKRAEQSRSVRLLLEQACDTRGVKLPSNFLSLSGLELIEHLDEKHRLSTSLAHSRGMVAVALGTGRLGLDIEQSGKKRNWIGIAKAFFTTDEAEKIQSVSIRQQEIEFLRHWVLKEARVKACKGGVFGDLNKLAICESGKLRISEASGAPAEPWRGWHATYGNFHIGICCQQNLEPNIQFYATGNHNIRNVTDDITMTPFHQVF